MTREVWFGTTTLALATGYYLMSSAIPQTLLSDQVGPDRLPKTYAVLLAVLSIVLIVRAVVRRNDAKEQSADSREPQIERRTLRRVAGMLLIGMLYILLIPWLGYFLSLAGLIMATTYYQGGVIDWKVVVVAVSGAAFFWLLFVLLLGIPQPPGFWSSLF